MLGFHTCGAMVDTVKQFSKVVVPVYTLTYQCVNFSESVSTFGSVCHLHFSHFGKCVVELYCTKLGDSIDAYYKTFGKYRKV